MLLVDANVLLHAVNERAREHDVSRAWLGHAIGSSEPVAFAWTVVLAFLRLSTHPAVFPRPLSPRESGDLVESWLASPAAISLEPTQRHLALVRSFLEQAGTAGNLVGDAHLAALALEHAATVVTFDRDFVRFEGVRVLRPS